MPRVLLRYICCYFFAAVDLFAALMLMLHAPPISFHFATISLRFFHDALSSLVSLFSLR